MHPSPNPLPQGGEGSLLSLPPGEGRGEGLPIRLLTPTLCLVFAFVVIKAASADLTWDEAWTYLSYARAPLGFARLDLANDHPLNSLLIWLSTRLFGNSELIIRIPNVLAGALYLYACARLVRAVRLRWLAFGLCVLQPFLLDFFSLARGYGLAAALVQYGLVAHFFAKDSRPRYATMLACVLLASLAIFPAAVALYALIAACLLGAVRHRRAVGGVGATARVSVAFAALGLVPVAGLVWVSRDGLPLYGSHAGFADAVLLGVARMYVSYAWSPVIGAGMALGIGTLIVAGARHFGRRATTLLLASALCLGATWTGAMMFGKPLPTGRLLLPWIPLGNLTIIAMAEDVQAAVPAQARHWLTAGSVLLCAALGFIYLDKLHFQRFAAWPGDYHIQNRLAQSLVVSKCLPPGVWQSHARFYYLDRWFLPQYRPPDYPCLPPDGGPDPSPP